MSHLLNVRENVVIPESSDYKSFMSERPVYRLLNVPPTGSSSFAVNSATVDSYFEITPNVFNFSKSFLEYKLVVNSPGANRYNYIYKNKPNVQAIDIYTKSGVHIVEINYINKMIWTIGRKNMKLVDYMSRSENSTCNPLHGKGIINGDYKAVATAAATNGYVGGAFPVKNAVANGNVVTDAPATADVLLLTVNAFNQANTSSENKRPDGTAVEDFFLENQYFIVGDSATATTVNVRFPLSDIAETLLSMDKDLYFKENLLVRVSWEPKTMVGYHTDSVIDPASTAAVFAENAVNFSGIQLRIAVQTNRKLIESTMALVDSGLSIDIPFVTYLRSPGGAIGGGGPLNANVKIGVGMGKTLLKVIHTLYSSDEKLNTAFDNSNRSVDGKSTTKVASYYTQINSQRIQDYNLVASTAVYDSATASAVGIADDYQWNSFFLKNSPIFNAGVYIANWFHEDNFSNVNNDSTIKEDQIASPGIPIDTELTWYFYGIAPAAGSNVIHHTIIVTRKTLTISPTGVTLK